MNNLKKTIIRILIASSVILILLVGLFILVIKKNGITEFDKKNIDHQPALGKTEKKRLNLSLEKKFLWKIAENVTCQKI